MFLTICLNPTLQKTLCFSSLVPATVNRTAVHRLDASGKGVNVTRVLNQLGKKAIHLTHLGGAVRPLFLSLCEQDGLSVEWVESNSEIRFCYTVINESDSKVTELVEESQPVSAGTEEKLLEKFNHLLWDTSLNLSCVIISGTKAAGYSDAVIPTMMRKAKEKGLRVILDIKGKDLIESLRYEPDIIKPNLEEFLQTFGFGKDGAQPGENLQRFVLELAQKHKCRIILTNGSKKIIAVENENYFELDVPAVKASAASSAQNTTGCGDAFTAGLAASLESGADFNTAINEGMKCGAMNASIIKPGAIN